MFSLSFRKPKPTPKPEPIAVIQLNHEQTATAARLFDALASAQRASSPGLSEKFALWSYIEDSVGYGPDYQMTLDTDNCTRFTVVVHHRR